MGEHLRKPKTHHVEIVTGPAVSGEQCAALAVRLEDAYGRINQRAMSEGMVVVSTVQTAEQIISHEAGGPIPYMCYTVTAQRVDKRELMEAQARQQLSLSGGRA